MREFKRYDVIVDYVTSITLTVSAPDEDAAGDMVEEYAATKEGLEDLLRRVAVKRNPEGFEVAYIEESHPRCPELYYSEIYPGC